VSEHVRRGKLLGWLVEPHPRIRSGDDRLGARLFGILMLVHILAVATLLPAVNFIWMRGSGVSIWNDADAKVVIAGVVLILASFLLLRFGFYRAGVLCYILIAISVAVVAPFVPGPNTEIGLLATAVIPVLLSAIVFSYRWVVTVLLTTLGVGTIQVLTSDMPPRQEATGFALLIAIAVTGILILVFRYHLGVLENHRIARIREGEETIRRSAERYRQLFETVTDGIMIASRQGKILEVNGAACRQLGYARQELLGRSVTSFSARVPGDVETTLRTVMEKGYAFYQTSHIRKDGSTLPVELSIAVVEFNSDKAFLGVVRDLTERRRIEQQKQDLETQLQQAAKMESLGVLAGGIAHDFNNFLCSMLGFTELAMAQTEKESGIFRCLDQIRSAGRRAAKLVNQILAFSRRTNREARAIRLQLVVEEAMVLLEITRPMEIEIHMDVDVECRAVLGDPIEIHQVVMNLVSNAFSAMRRERGALTIRLRERTIDEETATMVPSLRPGRYACLTVEDTGPGMDKATVGRIFEPFFTTKPVGEGTGLGLATVHGIVKEMGGGVLVESAPGCGTRFDVFMPVLVDEPAADLDSEDASRGLAESRTAVP
jgi:PAS domain S-box-containing protein